MAAVLWVALAVAFSPVLLDLFDHAATRPWARSSLVFVPLWLLAVWRDRGRCDPVASGYAWIVAGVALELFAVRVDAVRFARPGLALALIGLCQVQGLAKTQTAVLAFWLVPLPNVLRASLSPLLETQLAAWAALPLRWLGAAIEVDAGRVVVGSSSLVLRSADGGLPLMLLLAGLGWYASLRARADWRASFGYALRWGLAGLPLQLLALELALIGATLAGVGPARRLLDLAWIPIAAAAIAWAEREAFRRGPALSGRPRPHGVPISRQG